MAGYLDTYGVADQRRERIVKYSLITVISVILIGTLGYFTLRTHGQETVMDQFLGDLKSHQYMDAYRLWGCPEQCRLYPQEKFLEDWGPSSKLANSASLKIEHVDYCGDFVVFDISYPNADEIGLSVNRATGFISFYENFYNTTRCPGRHLQIGAFLKSLFS